MVILSGCGIQGQTYELKLQYPANLTWIEEASSNTQIALEFSCWNIEADETFSGYNIYLLYGQYSESNDLRNLVNLHRGLNVTDIEDRNPERYILEQNHIQVTYQNVESKILPTISKGEVVEYWNNTIRYADQEPIFSLEELGNLYEYPQGEFVFPYIITESPDRDYLEESVYTICVSAYYDDPYTPVESICSNIIEVCVPPEACN